MFELLISQQTNKRKTSRRKKVISISGSNDDGTEGAIEIGNNAGTVIVQDPHTALHPKMPLEVIYRHDPKVVASVEVLAGSIMKRVMQPVEKEKVYLRT